MTDSADREVPAGNGFLEASAGFPEKPPGSKWTDSQWRAVARRGRNLLVAAAAGSGKTAVLVERIIRRVSDEEDPVDVDRLLVATFTKAAAAEMRQRIGEALEKALYGLPDSAHLKRQLSLLNRASITTLHSFCMEVIRRYFHTIGLDPGFRVADDTEAALIRQEELEALLEERYGEAPEGHPFWTLADWYGGDRSDAALLALVERLYEASRSHPFPDRWLAAMAGMFQVKAGEGGADGVQEALDAHPWFVSLLKDVSLELDGAAALLGEALALCGMPGGPAPYAANLEEELRSVSAAAAAGQQGWTALYEAFGAVAFGRLKPVKGDSLDKELQERVKDLRGEAKEKLQKLREELFVRTPEEYLAELGRLAPVVDELCRLTAEFAERYGAAKRDKGLLDFADLEHMCLAILGKPAGEDGAELAPTAAALAYREQFVEVMLDEYQDTNLVQETIVGLISRPLPGNRFMVGDVKQSIYRFRLAEPGLFLAKYRKYLPGGGASAPGERIDLARNFRSRRQVVDAVNVLFRRVMRMAVAEMDYGRDAELVYGAGFPEHDGAADAAAAGPDYAAELVLLDKSDASPEGAGGSGETDTAADGEEDFSGLPGGGDGANGKNPWETEREELETAQLEARYIGSRIRALTGMDGGAPFPVAERDGSRRPARFRDVVILLRATRGWAPVFMEELALMGIPAYADIDTGYFTATEVETMLSLLKVIDNPRQDIPLAAVLRSPLVGLSADELAQIRLADRQGDYYGALEAWYRQAEEELQSEDGLRDEADGNPAVSPILLPYGVSAGGAACRETAASAAERQNTLGLQGKLKQFRERLAVWRRDAVQGDLSALIADIYRVTGYFDYVGGLPGGTQRQANLRALYDRARQYERTSFRGLFRFLRFVERMRESGGDLGTARTLGEQEDIVRIMSIHKSKGLEFPVVFVGGTAKGFNMMDLNGSFLIHKELGFGPRYKDEELQAVYPTLPQLAIRRRLRMETLAEEMRVLYVALTRAKEKLVLVGTVPSAAKRLEAAGGKAGAGEGAEPQSGGVGGADMEPGVTVGLRRGGETRAQPWDGAAGTGAGAEQGSASCAGNGAPYAADLPPLPDYLLASARSYLDWVLPAVLAAGAVLAPWQVHTVHAATLSGLGAAAAEAADGFADKLMEAVRTLEPMPVPVPDGSLREEVSRRLGWVYPNPDAGAILTKTSVTELKRLEARRILSITEAEESIPGLGLWLPPQAAAEIRRGGYEAGGGESLLYRTPRFRKSRKLSAAETGVLYHTAMQHMPLDGSGPPADIEGTLDRLAEAGFINPSDREALDARVIAAFFATDVGRRLALSKEVRRELAFTLGLEAGELYPDCAPQAAGELVLLQGIIDCLFADSDGRLVLLDYKTDRTAGRSDRELAERYRVQLKLYERAVTDIWGRKPDELAVYFFDEARLIRL
ncbi:UvrD-helicase domain-containing protein [Paenibacillus sp. YN15]|uniref:UvrD-helicase domain-containing protein n=1 Tax=Paenibacillus sp. YN15 TaxID=1742774 RepID=UPI000DCEEA33|nr:UvrD-helicase domain-containing protein [Paenibacillus sp. YN15]RAU94213.1 ATP-dependent helicase [Paenibacillus sp. YN15]